jgi:hypothetical protein
MQRLIRRCWSQKPEDRPSMEEIFIEFQSNNFAIIPEAISDVVREYVLGVIAWETSRDLSGQRETKMAAESSLHQETASRKLSKHITEAVAPAPH